MPRMRGVFNDIPLLFYARRGVSRAPRQSRDATRVPRRHSCAHGPGLPAPVEATSHRHFAAAARRLLVRVLAAAEHREGQLGELALAERTLGGDDLHDAVLGQAALLLEQVVPLALELGEAVVERGAEALAPGELVLGAAQRLHHAAAVHVARAHREQDLADLDARDGAVRLTEGAAHAGLQTIGAGAREHLVDAQHVPRVHADAQVERVLAAVLDHVLVARDARRLERLGRDL